MNFFVEAAQHSPKSIRNAPDSGNIVPSENQTFMGFVRSLISAIEPWHLNMLAGLLVTTFVYWQFSSMFVARLRPKQQKHESFKTQKPIKKKEFADKQVGDDLDIIDDHDEFQNAKEILYRGPSYPEEEMCKRSQLFYEAMKLRRSVRCFSNKSIPMKIVQNIIKTAGTSPSGANLQPWTFCVVASEHLKTKIREIVETEEQINYSRRMGAKWVLDVEHLNVNWNKPYLTEAPYLIVVMKHTYQILDNGQRQPTYYNEISTCLATGIMLTAIHNAGLVTVVTTPLNAGGQIRNLLQRPPNEKVVMLLPLGYPLENAHVPDIKRKPIEEIIRIY